jgi:hypothetical protein
LIHVACVTACWPVALDRRLRRMLRLVADENLNNSIVRGLLRRQPELDIVRIQDVGLSGADDPTVLEWAAREGRVLLTHDVSTIIKYAYERVRAGQPMPGVFEVGRNVPISRAIEDILLLAEYSFDNEWEGQVRYLPL